MFEKQQKSSEHQQKNVNNALPPPEEHLCSLRRQSAFETLALADIQSVEEHGTVPHPADSAVEQARNWVEYDEL